MADEEIKTESNEQEIRKFILETVEILEARFTDNIAKKISEKAEPYIKEHTERIEAENLYLQSLIREMSVMTFFKLPLGTMFLQKAIKKLQTTVEKPNEHKGKQNKDELK